MLKKLVFLCLASFVTGAALAEDPLGGPGETVQIWRHTFGRNLAEGRKTILRDMLPMLSRDKVTRSTVIGENTRTGELVIVHFSDAFNVARRDNTPWADFMARMKKAHALGQKPVRFSNYQLFAVHDEGVAAQPGALLMFWWRKVQPGKQSIVRQHLLSRLMPRLGKDTLRRSLYLAESYDEAELVNIGVSDPASPGQQHRQLNDLVTEHYREPVRVETFRIIAVNREGTRSGTGRG